MSKVYVFIDTEGQYPTNFYTSKSDALRVLRRLRKDGETATADSDIQEFDTLKFIKLQEEEINCLKAKVKLLTDKYEPLDPYEGNEYLVD